MFLSFRLRKQRGPAEARRQIKIHERNPSTSPRADNNSNTSCWCVMTLHLRTRRGGEASRRKSDEYRRNEGKGHTGSRSSCNEPGRSGRNDPHWHRRPEGERQHKGVAAAEEKNVLRAPSTLRRMKNGEGWKLCRHKKDSFLTLFSSHTTHRSQSFFTMSSASTPPSYFPAFLPIRPDLVSVTS